MTTLHEHKWDSLQVTETMVHRACTVCGLVQEDITVSEGHVVTVGRQADGWGWACTCGKAGVTSARSTAFEHADHPDAGHTFRITVEIRGSSKFRGETHHRDDPHFDPMPNQVTVRAWSLREALEKAALLPLDDWFEENE